MKARLEFKKQDCWIGVYWRKGFRHDEENYPTEQDDIWICIIPCFPLHIVRVRTVKTLHNKEQS